MDSHDPPTPAFSDATDRPGPFDFSPATFVAAGLAALALLVSAYLSYQSIRGNPIAGCGADDGCGAVLASPWAKVGEYPVSLLGAAVYSMILLALGLRSISQRYRLFADALLICAVPVLIGAAAWFSYVQLIEIGVLCLFCMVGHGLGIAIAVTLIFILAKRRAAGLPGPVAVGLLGVGLLAFVQTFAPVGDTGRTTDSPQADRDYDRINTQGQREVGLFGGSIELILQQTPHIGDQQAEQVLAIVFDYNCPHCREMRDLLEQMQADGSDFVLVLLPMSIDPEHNEHIQSESPQFKESHAIAMMSLWLFDTDPEAWATFDRWLIEAADYRSAKDAAAKANELLPDQNLSSSEVLSAIDNYRDIVHRNIATLSLIPEDNRAIPVLTAPGSPSHLTERVYRPRPIRDLLERAQAGLVQDETRTNGVRP